jgi:MoaA/NifB/PqqE/SkfB family radical SAM enzyme
MEKLKTKVLRAKNRDLFAHELTDGQSENSRLNLQEMEGGRSILTSYPRRLVLELTNACNLKCIMCGREHTDFTPTFFRKEWLERLVSAMTKSEEVVLHGWGEPTVHPGFSEIMKWLDRYPVRKYFCTNGMLLDEIEQDIFGNHLDILAVSLDGATAETNDGIRVGVDFGQITRSLEGIVARREREKLGYPYINLVFTAMKRNLEELPQLVRLAADLGLEEVKAVYLTSFSDELDNEVLWDEKDRVKQVFNEAMQEAERTGVRIKLPHLQGVDPADRAAHRDCYFPYRDLFIGSDGRIRPCVSSDEQLGSILDTDFMDCWNQKGLRDYRDTVNLKEGSNETCNRCYHSSCANWNQRSSFIQTGARFAPEWS